MADSGLKHRTAKGLLWGGIGNGAMQLLNLLFGFFRRPTTALSVH